MELKGNAVLIRLDPENDKTKSGTLYKPDGAMEDVFRTGEILRVGPGKYLFEDQKLRQPIDVKPGDGVVFIKFLATHTETAKGIQKYLGEDEAILQLSDIMLVYDRADPPEFGQ
jgi:co-chaperonin GroES (HSP10)